MAHTDSLYVVASAIYNKLLTAKTTLGLQDVFYGDQQLIPRTPAIAVESGPKTRTLSGAGGTKGRTENVFTIYLMLYVNKIQSPQQNEKDVEQLAEIIETFLHQDTTLGGLIIHGFVNEILPGYAQRGQNLLRMARLTWAGKTLTMI